MLKLQALAQANDQRLTTNETRRTRWIGAEGRSGRRDGRQPGHRRRPSRRHWPAEGMRAGAGGPAARPSWSAWRQASPRECLVQAVDLRDPEAPDAVVAAALQRVLAHRPRGQQRRHHQARRLLRADRRRLGRRATALKFFAAMRLCRAAWPHLRQSGGCIVNIAGMGGRTASAEFTIGGSVNAAMLNLTKALADRGVQDGVRVNAINPGLVVTDRLKARIAQVVRREGRGRGARPRGSWPPACASRGSGSPRDCRGGGVSGLAAHGLLPGHAAGHRRRPDADALARRRWTRTAAARIIGRPAGARGGWPRVRRAGRQRPAPGLRAGRRWCARTGACIPRAAGRPDAGRHRDGDGAVVPAAAPGVARPRASRSTSPFSQGELGRFRVNLHFERGRVAAAIRALPTRVPSLARARLQPRHLAARTAAARAAARVRPHRLRQDHHRGRDRRRAERDTRIATSSPSRTRSSTSTRTDAAWWSRWRSAWTRRAFPWRCAARCGRRPTSS